MKLTYEIKPADELSPLEIAVILNYWEEREWNTLTVEEFKEKFSGSEFHLLRDENSGIYCLTRINFDFKIELNHSVYNICELVGLVSVTKNRGYGQQLLQHIVHNLTTRKIECIGFCAKELRPFYEKCKLSILYNKAEYLQEKIADGQFEANSDDDIVIISIADDQYKLLAGLNENCIGYLLF